MKEDEISPGRDVSKRPTRESQRRAGQRAGFTREEVLAEARRIADRTGVGSLSMRRLAAELGVAPNALYTYFPSKLALLDALLEQVLGEIQLPPRTHLRWPDDLLDLMRKSREALLNHPRLIELFFARPGGRNAWKLGEVSLQLLKLGGVHGQQAVTALRTLLAFTLGFAATEAPRPADGSAGERQQAAREMIRQLPSAEFPLTQAAADHFASPPGDTDFEAGLACILAGLTEGKE